MSRVGWVFLGIVALVAAAFVAMTSFGGGGVRHPAPPPVASASPPPTMGSVVGSLPALIVPVAGVARGAVVDTWGQARSEGRAHHGTDIPAALGTPVLAAADGRVEKLFDSQLGGMTLYQRSADGRWVYYYAHLSAYAPGIAEGVAVRAGQAIAAVGDTGDAGAGNYHLHFGLTRMAPGERWYQGEPVNAYPALAGSAAAR